MGSVLCMNAVKEWRKEQLLLEKFTEEVPKKIEEAGEHLNLIEIYPDLEMERYIKTWEIQLSFGGYNSTNAK